MKIKLNREKTLPIALLVTLTVFVVCQGISMTAAQTDVATVIVMPTTGGTTDPTPGQYTYNNGTNIVLTAIPDSGYTFSYWIISGELLPGHTTSQAQPVTVVDPNTGEVIGTFPARVTAQAIDSLVFSTNPTNITCGYGYTYIYTAVFAPATPATQPSPAPTSTDAVVIVMPTNGGTVSPAAGLYTYPNGSVITISATPNPGYQFSYWLVSGNYTQGHGDVAISTITDDSGQAIGQVPRVGTSGIDSITFTANPAKITCGYGYTYTYTAIFSAASSTPTPTVSPTLVATASPEPTATPAPTPTPTAGTDWTIWIVIAAVIIVIVIVVVAAVLMRKKK